MAMRIDTRRMPVKRPSRTAKSEDVFGQRRRSSKMFRAGLYARVSTNDQQTLPMQNRALREYAARRGWTVAMQVREVGSGAVERKAREHLMEAARRREIDVVLVWRLDRWGRSRSSPSSNGRSCENELEGLAHARDNGKQLGRPATAAVHAAEIRKLHRAGISKSEIARRLQVGRTSVRRILLSKVI